MPIVVNHGVLETATTDLSGDAAYLQQTLDELDAQVRALSANWEGEAQQAYLTAKRQWTESMTNIRQTLNSISTLLGATNDRFRTIDQQGAAMFG